jgi:hypothetical protein
MTELQQLQYEYCELYIEVTRVITGEDNSYQNVMEYYSKEENMNNVNELFNRYNKMINLLEQQTDEDSIDIKRTMKMDIEDLKLLLGYLKDYNDGSKKVLSDLSEKERFSYVASKGKVKIADMFCEKIIKRIDDEGLVKRKSIGTNESQ